MIMSLTTQEEQVQLWNSKLFDTFQLNALLNLQHRIVMAPLSRNRSHDFNLDKNSACKYYGDRSKTPGTLIITELAYVGLEYTGFLRDSPGMFTDEQFEIWKLVFYEIHLNRSFVFAQLWATGRQAEPELLSEMGLKYYGVSTVYENDRKKQIADKIGNTMDELNIDQLSSLKKAFLKLGHALLKAGADGIEIHSCGGSLLHQFLSSETNKRKDKYGGSIENRARFVLDLIDCLLLEIDSSKIGIRLSPFSKVYSSTNPEGISYDTLSQHAYLIERLELRAKRGKRLAYIHLMEPLDDSIVSNEFVLSIWKGVLIRCGTYLNRIPKLIHDVNKDNTLIAVGRYFISNPDLYYKVKNNINLTEPLLEYFNYGGDVGYNDYPRVDGL